MIKGQLKLWLMLAVCLVFIYFFFGQISREDSKLAALGVSSKFRYDASIISSHFGGATSLQIPISPHLPDDYGRESKETDQWCSDYYGPTYLQYSASHHAPYCEADVSHSSLECFHTQAVDPFCIARGVLLDNSRVNHTDDTRNTIALHCKLHDWMIDNKTEGLEGFKNIPDMPDYFYWTGARRQLQSWDIGTGEINTIDGSLCKALENDNKYTLLVRREANNNIWHKIMEMWQSMLTLDILHIAINPKTSKPYLSPTTEVEVIFEDNDNGPVDFLWDEWWREKPIIRKSTINRPVCLSNVILPLAGSSSPFWKAHWDNRDCHETLLLDVLLKRFYRLLKIDPPKARLTETTTVTIVDRKQVRKIYDIERHAATLQRRWPDAKVQTVDFGNMTLEEQVRTVHETDVLVGVIGAGLTHILFMPPESSIAEIMSIAKMDYSGFRNLAKMRGLNYVSVHGKNATDWEELGHRADAQELENHKEKERLKQERKNAQKKRQKRERGREEDDVKGEASQNEGEEEAQKQTKVVPEREEAGKIGKRSYWQEGEYVYIEDDLFQSLVDAAINAQLNRGLRRTDVVPASKHGG